MSEAALASNALFERIRAQIAAEGPISLATYIETALFDPQAGYYATRDPLGARGDFITAPEVSQVFGELVGLWCVELWQRLGAPDPVLLVELGPGRGTLLGDALRAARVMPAFGRARHLHLVERSAVLRRAQAEALGDTSPAWHETLATLPPGPLLLIANEFLDALPIRQFQRASDGWHERRVGLAADGATLEFILDPVPSLVFSPPPGLADAPVGSLCETRPAAQALAQALGSRLAASGGAALFIDYGHHPSACGDTLQAMRRHRRHDVLADPGTADLTAHVDFAAFAATATAAGARAWGPTTQGAFLRALGIEARTAGLAAHATPAQALLLATGSRRLVDPAAMGRLFKVMALTHRAAPCPAGFATEHG